MAIKAIRGSIDEGTRRQFHEEVQAHAGLQHPGIVYLFEYGETGEAGQLDGEFASGSPYVVMELADRGTLRDAMPVSNWETVCRLLVQMLDALAYANARGVVHRDLKPENVLLFDEAGGWRAKLADFGIAHVFDSEREAETQKLETAAGTPYYMAPEQLRGQWRDYGPWTDLYAVGCIAWELVCGRPPFDGETPFALAMSHETDERPTLDPRFPVPDELESWIHRAMAVEPERRFRRAADAVWALPRAVLADAPRKPSLGAEQSSEGPTADGESTVNFAGQTRIVTLTKTIDLSEPEDTACAPTLAAEQVEAPEPEDIAPAEAEQLLVDMPPTLPVDWRTEQVASTPAPLVGAGLGLFGLREPPFVNRSDECEAIWEALREVVGQGTLRSVFVAGEAGTGKSRLAGWMATRAHEVGAAQVIRAFHTSSGGPTEGLRGGLEEALRTLKMERGEVFEHLEDDLPPLREGDGDWRERDARALTEYLRPTDDEADRVDGPRYRFSSPDQKRALLVRTLRRLARRRPVLLWVDDLQWGREAVGLLEYLQDAPDPPAGLLVLATLRSDLLQERHDLDERIDALAETETAGMLPLEPLSKNHQRALLMDLLPLEDQLADRLAARTEGHPLFAMQLLGHWIEEDAIEMSSAGFRVGGGRELDVPEDVHELWMRRLHHLVTGLAGGELDRVWQALEMAAALGRQIDGAEWQAVCRQCGVERPVRLRDELVVRGLAERTDQGWAFAHGLLVDSLERRARELGRWQTHHRRCGEMLERLKPERLQQTAARRADHFVEAGEAERALDPLWEVVTRTAQVGEVRRALETLRRRKRLLDSLEVPPGDERRIENALETAHMKLVLGESPDELIGVLSDFRRRAEAADLPSLVAHSWRWMAMCQDRQGNRRKAVDCCRRATEIARSNMDEVRLVAAVVQRAWVEYQLGDFEAADQHAGEARRWARACGKTYQEMMARYTQGWIASARGEEQRAVEHFEAALETSRLHGYRGLEAQILNGLGEVARYRGDVSRARRCYQRYRRAGRELDIPEAAAMGELNLAQVELMAGNVEIGGEYLERSDRRLEESDCRAGRIHIIRMARLAEDAGAERWHSFDEILDPYEDGWPEEARLIRDHPWLLELAGGYAAEAGESVRARRAWRLARQLWEALDDREAVERVDGLLD